MIMQDIKLLHEIPEEFMLSKNLTLEEFKCRCTNEDCNYTLVSSRVISNFQTLRDLLDRPLTINSGFRCKKHNEAVGGAKKSKHTMGLAIDISTKGMSETVKFRLIENARLLFDYTQVYIGLDFIHCHVEKNRNYI